MFQSDLLILRILHQSFEIERPKGHWSEVVVHLYFKAYPCEFIITRAPVQIKGITVKTLDTDTLQN